MDKLTLLQQEAREALLASDFNVVSVSTKTSEKDLWDFFNSLVARAYEAGAETERGRILEILKEGEILQRMFDMDGMVNLYAVEKDIHSPTNTP